MDGEPNLSTETSILYGRVIVFVLKMVLLNPILSPFPFLSSYLQMNPAASLPPTFLGSLPLPYAFSTFSQTLHRPAALYSQPAPSPLGAREPLPISHQLLWLKQGGQSPLDPKGAPMYRDMSKPWVKLGRFG